MIWFLVILATIIFIFACRHESKSRYDKFEQYKSRGWTFDEFSQFDSLTIKEEQQKLEELLDSKHENNKK